MKAVKTILTGGAALAVFSFAAPASAQIFPGMGYGSGDILTQVIGGMMGGGSYRSPYGYGGSPYGYGSPYGGSPYGYGSPYGGAYGAPMGYGTPGYGSPYAQQRGYGQSNQYAVGQCMGAVQQKLNGAYGTGGARVLGVSDVQPRNQGGMLVSGVANSGRTGAYGYNGGQPPVDLTFTCKTDASGQVASIDVGQATATADARYGVPTTSPYAENYSQYGYTRY